MTARCTHGGDCTVHPTVRGLHDFTPTASAALSAVVRMAVILGGCITTAQIQQLAVGMGVELEPLTTTPPPENTPKPLNPNRTAGTWTGHGKPAAGIWGGFVVPDADLHNRLEDMNRIGSACTLGCVEGRIVVTFPDGQEFRFGIARTFSLGVM